MIVWTIKDIVFVSLIGIGAFGCIILLAFIWASTVYEGIIARIRKKKGHTI